jgi:predicted amidohydrolase
MRDIEAAVVQLRAESDKTANLAAAEAAIRRAAAEGAELVALPEVFAWRGPQAREAEQAETIPGPTADRMAALAAELGIHLVAGSMLERQAGQERVVNTCLLLGPDGRTLAAYRKIHLFDIDLPGHVTIRESDTRAPGTEPVVVDTALGRIGLAVCYDLRFPELFRRLAAGPLAAEIVVMPSGFTRPTGQAHWEVLVRARAIENQCFVLAPNQWGRASQGFLDHGHSLLVDPWGKILAEGPPDDDAVLFARLQSERLESVRRELPCLTHRRLPG